MKNSSLQKSRDTTDSSLTWYLDRINKIPMLTREEEDLYARLAKNGDPEAKNVLVKSNLRFVVSIAKKYQTNGISLLDLINEGNMGLIKAAEKFDPDKGFHFISYAVWWIRQAILQALAEQARIVRLPVNKIGSINRINRAFSKLEQEFEREPSSQEIAEMLEMIPEDVKEGLRTNGRTLSMDAPISSEEDNTMYDVIQSDDTPSPDKNLINESLAYEIERALCTLSPREAKVLKLYFGLGMKHPFTLEEIGEELNLTRERVRQIKEKAIKRIQFTTRCRILKTYLG